MTPDKKGQRDGLCNRAACQRPGATFFNTAMDAWYCPTCAAKINYWSLRDAGRKICVPAEAIDAAFMEVFA